MRMLLSILPRKSIVRNVFSKALRLGKRSAAVGCVALLGSSCSTYHMHEYPIAHYQPTDPLQIRVYDRAPEQPYEVIGQVHYETKLFQDIAERNERLKMSAAKMGGDAVILFASWTDHNARIICVPNGLQAVGADSHSTVASVVKFHAANASVPDLSSRVKQYVSARALLEKALLAASQGDIGDARKNLHSASAIIANLLATPSTDDPRWLNRELRETEAMCNRSIQELPSEPNPSP